MLSARLSIGLGIALLVGIVAVAPGAVTAQEDQVTLTVTVVDQDGNTLGGVPISASWDDGDGGPVNETTSANGQALMDVPRGVDVSLEIDDDEYVHNTPYVVENATTQQVNVSVSPSATATVTIENTDGQAVENARVLLYRSGDFVTDQRTDADGVVTTPEVEEGDYDLYIRRSGYYNNQTDVTLDGETSVTRTIEQGTVGVTFNVTDDHSQPPEAVEGASVEIPGSGTIQTLSNGERQTNLPVNTQYTVEVSKDGYETTEQSVSIGQQATTVNVSIQRTPELNVAAPSQAIVGQSIELEVTDEYNESVPNATVTRGGEDVGTTDANGEVDVTIPSAGQVNYTVSDGTAEATIAVEGYDPDATDIPENLSTPTSTPTETATSGGSGPGFTPVTAVVALLALSLLAYRRR